MKMTVYSTHGIPAEIEGKDIGLEVGGKRFIVHKNPFYFCPKWTVTETSTGFAVCSRDTKTKAIEEARLILDKRSAEQMEEVCAKALKKLTDMNLLAPGKVMRDAE